MYAARKQNGQQHDENKQEETNPAGAGKAKACKGKAPPLPSINRRTLGDISNLVGGIPAPGNAPKDGITETTNAVKTIPVVDRPVTRSFVAQLASNPAANSAANEAAIKLEDPHGWGTKQRRTAKSKDQKSALLENPKAPVRSDPSATTGTDSKPSGDVDIPPGHPERMKALLKNRNGKAGAAIPRRGKTLTATLTARSEAACGNILSKSKDREEPLPNIDEADIGNQLAVTDYVEDIYSFYRKTEVQSCVPPDYMSNQTEINGKMRAILIDWLIEVQLKFKLMPETLFLTVNVLDRYLSIQGVGRKKLQLVGMTATLIAAKYEEIWAPEVNDFIMISDNAYTRQQVLDMEKFMLNTLRFNLTVPTPYVFLVRFLKAAASDRQMEMLAFFLVELSLVEYMMVKYPPSIIAAAAVYTAQCCLQNVSNWTTALRCHSGYTEAQLKDCATAMVNLHKQAKVGNLSAICRKYSLSKFNSVAELTPATFPTDDSENSNT